MNHPSRNWRARMRAAMDAFVAGLKDCSPAEAILIRLGYMAGYEQGRKDRQQSPTRQPRKRAMTYPMTARSYPSATRIHREYGGYLLNLGRDWRGNAVYVICDAETAKDYGRTDEQLAALAPTYREPR